MLPPNNMPLGRLAKHEGISTGTLAKWRAEARAKGQFLPDAKAGPEGWSSEDKLEAMSRYITWSNILDAGPEALLGMGLCPQDLINRASSVP